LTSGDRGVILPAAKESDRKSRKGTFPACTGVYTLPCPAGSTTKCCDPDVELCYNGSCYPFV
jgi:hypothetical protein